jgi:hypothetical protein
MGSTGLRASLIWHDEVMGDVVNEKPAPITIGTAGDATFTTPAIGGVPVYSIVTPGRRGYLLTLSAQMSGTICIGGVEHEVSAWVAAGDDPAGFRGTPIAGNDWGVIALDEHHKLFFQFVPLEEAEWNLGHPMILAAVGGTALSALALTGLWWWKGVPLGEAAFRGGSLSSLAIGLAAIVRWALRQDNESRASLAFSVMLHAALLFATFQLYEKSTPFEWPARPSVTGGYVVKLDDHKAPTPPSVAPTVMHQGGMPLPVRHAWERPVGKKVATPGKRIAAAIPKPDELGHAAMPMPTIETPKIGVMIHEDILHGIAQRDVGGAIAKVGKLGPADGQGRPGVDGPAGTKDGGIVGKDGIAGKGQRIGDLDVGKPRNAVVCAGARCGAGDEIAIAPPPVGPTDREPTLSRAEIERVIAAHRGMFTACYQKELDKLPALSGDVTMHFEIAPDGHVKSSAQSGGTLRNDNVVGCMKRALSILKFPAKGGALVNYPFVFSAQ